MDNNEKSPPKADQPRAEKILIWVFVVLIAASVGVTYWRIMLKRDYVISSQVECDPTMEKCFVWECDPASTVDGEKCTGDAETDIWYYKLAERNASKIPLCDPAKDETCLPFVCEEGEKDCSETLCDEETKIDQGVECSDPVEYLKANPPEEEVICDPEAEEDCEVPEEEGEATADGSTDATDSATPDAEEGETL
jgi:hypothetical protein